MAKEHGLDVAAVAGRSAEYKAMSARRACWRRLVASGSSVAQLAEAWGVAYKTVAVEWRQMRSIQSQLSLKTSSTSATARTENTTG